MRYIITIFFICCVTYCFAQYPGTPQFIGTDSNVVKARGGLQGRIIPISYTDTTAANRDRIRQYPGAEIYTTSDNKKWYRNSTATGWTQYGSGTGINIYNSDGELTSDRTLNGLGTYALTLDSLTQVIISSKNRINGNISYLFEVDSIAQLFVRGNSSVGIFQVNPRSLIWQNGTTSTHSNGEALTLIDNNVGTMDWRPVVGNQNLQQVFNVGSTLTKNDTVSTGVYAMRFIRNSSTTNPGTHMLMSQAIDTITNGSGFILGSALYINKRNLFPNTIRSDYMGGVIFNASYEAKDSVYIYSVGGDFGWNVGATLTLTKYPGQTSRTVLQGGTVDFDAVPNDFANIQTFGSTSSTNNIRARGFWAIRSSYVNVTSTNDTIDNLISYEASGFNQGKILKQFDFYSTAYAADSSWSLFSKDVSRRLYNAGPASFGGGVTGPTEAVEITGNLKMYTLPSSHNANDSMVVWNPTNKKFGFQPIPTGSSGVTSVAAGYGTNFTTITSTGSVIIDSFAMATRARVQKGIDSVAALITATSGWSLSGNAAMAGSSFIGTTNLVSFRFRVNNTQEFVIDSTGHFIVGPDPGDRTAYDGQTTTMSFKQSGNGTAFGITFLNAANNATHTTVGTGGLASDQPIGITSVGGNIYMNAPTNLIGGNFTGNSTLQVNGSFAAAYVAKTGTYTATISDGTINATSGTFTITLPSASGITGRVYTITNSGAGTITIATTSSQTFTNVVATPTTLTMAAVGTNVVQSDGANWLLISTR